MRDVLGNLHTTVLEIFVQHVGQATLVFHGGKPKNPVQSGTTFVSIAPPMPGNILDILSSAEA